MGHMSEKERVTQHCECGETTEAEWDVCMQIFEDLCPGAKHRFTCPACKKKQLATEAEERRIQFRQQWIDRNVPPIYQDTDLTHESLDRAAIKAVLEWDFKKGIGLIGDTGKGKTRLLFHALLRAYDVGISGRYISHNAFSVLIMEAFAGDEKKDAKKRLDNIRNADMLLIDDVGKAPRTERADAEFEELIEHRVSHHLPILWSANAGGKWLENRFGEDRGPALVRRLAQFCNCITLR
jgi:DNA replication protein DnaC